MILDSSVTSHESAIGALNHEITVSAAQSALKTSHGKRKNQTFTEKDRYLIGNTHLKTEPPLHNKNFNHHMVL